MLQFEFPFKIKLHQFWCCSFQILKEDTTIFLATLERFSRILWNFSLCISVDSVAIFSPITIKTHLILEDVHTTSQNSFNSEQFVQLD